MKANKLILNLLLVIAVPSLFGSGGPTGNKPSRIAFVSYRDGNAEIYVMNEDGSGRVNLTKNPAEDVNPVWSPDGTKIAFETFRKIVYENIHGYDDEIYVMNADGSGQKNLTNRPGFDSEGGRSGTADTDDCLEPTARPVRARGRCQTACS